MAARPVGTMVDVVLLEDDEHDVDVVARPGDVPRQRSAPGAVALGRDVAGAAAPAGAREDAP
ncbi:hypothetical protein ICW40_07675, partial [Actinotalea ferrariae]|uniref:hypothetical protein n=1 Tax=Actinotalea ferrariae TaxID=1386098 RepID=UPI001C8CC49D